MTPGARIVVLTNARLAVWTSVLLVAIVTTIMLAVPASAQMFSIEPGEKVKTKSEENYTMLGLSLEWVDFSYRGAPQAQGGRADFTNPIVRIRFESPGIRLSTGFGGSLTGMEDVSFANINAQIENGVQLARGASASAIVPIQLITDLLAVRPSGQSYEFQQSSVIFGTGLRFQYRPSGGGLAEIETTGNYGFSFSQGSLFGGSLFRAIGGAKLYLPIFPNGRAIVFGYNADFRSYDIEGELNDYRYISHAFTIGYGF
jgi:hypothetical protein